MSFINLELKPGTRKHDKLRDLVMDRFMTSHRFMSSLHSRWSDNEDAYKAYMKTSDVDAAAKAKKKNRGEPEYVTIEVPYSYSIMMAMHTYMSSIFLSRSPIFQYSARHGQPQEKVDSVEALIDYQVNVGEMMVPLYQWLWGMPKYGFSFLGNYWTDEECQISEIVEEEETIFGIKTGKMKKKKRVKTYKGYQGNKVYNIAPRDAYPDPRFPLDQFQKGEFFGRTIPVSWSYLKEQEANEVYFNIEACKDASGNAKSFPEALRPRNTANSTKQAPDELGSYFSGSSSHESAGSLFILLEMEIQLFPRSLGIGQSDRPEKWVITLCNGVIIGARPLGRIHNKFSASLLQLEIDQQEFASRSMFEILEPLNNVVTWLINSHMYNVRKALNDVRVVDPSRIVMSDLTKPGPGGVIRLKPEYYGTDTKQAVHQLDTRDVTQTHLKDMQTIEQLMQRASGVVDNLMGMVNTTGRRTATEVRTSSGFSINRLKTVAEYNAALGFTPLSQMLLQNTQQYYDDEQKFRVAGAMMQEDKFINTTPESIAGFYDYVPVDGSMPIDRLAQANFWKELILQVGRAPQLAQQFDLVRMLKHTMELVGERNIDQYIRVKTVPDQQLTDAAAAGNVVPLGGEGSGSSTAGGGDSAGLDRSQI